MSHRSNPLRPFTSTRKVTNMPRHRLTKHHIDHCFNTTSILSPLYFLVSPDALPDILSNQSLNIMRFPSELQLAVFEQCDSSTLFQLMHVNSTIQSQAAKLFWAHHEPWYHFESDWLVNKHGSPGLAHHCPEFAANVQQVSVHFGGGSPPLMNNPDDDRYSYGKLTQTEWIGQIDAFWTAFNHSFPQVKRLLLSTRKSHEDPTVLLNYDLVVERAPRALQILFVAPHEAGMIRRPKETLWRPQEDIKTGKFDLIVLNRDCQEQRVLMPLKSAT